MSSYEAPAKLNLSLLVSPPRPDGYHPVESMVQTIEWCDRLDADPGEGEDVLEVAGDVEAEGNLVLRAMRTLRDTVAVPPLALYLTKSIPVAAGLGGGSSDAAAALRAGADQMSVSDDELQAVASRVGADVPLFLVGGSLLMTGVGERLERLRPLEGFAFAVAVPDFGLVTADVYRRWDELEGPEGPAVSIDRIPPALRDQMPMRNDLTPAALDLEPRLGDFMADVAKAWGTTVSLTGSGSACFGYFPSLDEAEDAAVAVDALATAARGVGLRGHGVRRLDDLLDREVR